MSPLSEAQFRVHLHSAWWDATRASGERRSAMAFCCRSHRAAIGVWHPCVSGRKVGIVPPLACSARLRCAVGARKTVHSPQSVVFPPPSQRRGHSIPSACHYIVHILHPPLLSVVRVHSTSSLYWVLHPFHPRSQSVYNPSATVG